MWLIHEENGNLQPTVPCVKRDGIVIEYRLPDGRLMVFKANAVVRIPYLDTVEFAFRKPHIVALETALSDLLATRIGAAAEGA